VHSPDTDPLAALSSLERSSITPGLAREILPRLLALSAALARTCAFSTPASDSEPDDALLTVAQAAAALHMSESYVYDSWRLLGGRKFGRSVRFSRSALNEYAMKTQDNDGDTRRPASREAGKSMHRQSATR